MRVFVTGTTGFTGSATAPGRTNLPSRYSWLAASTVAAPQASAKVGIALYCYSRPETRRRRKVSKR